MKALKLSRSTFFIAAAPFFISGAFGAVVHIDGAFEGPFASNDPYTPFFAGVGSDLFTWGVPQVDPSILPATIFIDDGGNIIENGFGETDGTQASPENIYPNQVPGSFNYIKVSDYTSLTGKTLLESANFLEFTPNSVNVIVGEDFILGNLRYNNGVSLIGTEIETINLDISSSSTTPNFDQFLSLKIAIGTTGNTGTPEENADYIFFPDYPEFGSLRVLEGSFADVELKGRFGSLLFEGFGEIEGTGFLNSSITANLSSVPDGGSTAALLALSAAGLGFLRRRIKP